MNVALINDSFPPMIDGVSRSVLGYAKALHEGGYGKCIVVVPHIPRLKYDYPFPVYGFASIKIPYDGYRAGHPFMPRLLMKMKALDIDIIHAHSPFISMTLARELQRYLKIPIVFTQHTKWDFDIAMAVSSKMLRKRLEHYAYSNIAKADDLWAVSRGAGEYLLSRGYKGSFTVMPNGTDFPPGSADPDLLAHLNTRYNLPDGVPVFLFVGRMKWYKNIRIILDTLELLNKSNFDFRMFFVGDGDEVPEIKKVTADKGIAHLVHFVGKVTDRKVLMTYFMRSDLFIFLSSYDNAPLVVREAAACACPSLVLQGSSTSEIISDGVNGFIVRENAVYAADTIQKIFADRKRLEDVSKAASEQVYLTWEKAIEHATERYEVVKKAYDYNRSQRKRKLS